MVILAVKVVTIKLGHPVHCSTLKRGDTTYDRPCVNQTFCILNAIFQFPLEQSKQRIKQTKIGDPVMLISLS